jgi:hypothetical protein
LRSGCIEIDDGPEFRQVEMYPIYQAVATLASGSTPRRDCLASAVSRCMAANWRFVILGDASSFGLPRNFERRRAAPPQGLPQFCHRSLLLISDAADRVASRLGGGEDMSMASDLDDLWRQRQEVGAALNSGLLANDDPAWERFPDLDEAIREARPTDPAGLAVQMRLLADQFAASGHVADEKLALRIATVLEKLV